MKSLAISYKGMEDVTALEIKEILNTKTEIKESCIIFEAKSKEELENYCYRAQAVNRCLILLDRFKITKLEDLKRISKIDFSFLKNKTFAARCDMVENKNFLRQEIEAAAGDEIEAKVDLKKPDVIVFAYIYKDNCYIGIDLFGDLSKRNYKINTNRYDIKGTIAYSLTRIAGFDGNGIFIDPFCANGTVAIEAGLFASNLPVNYYNEKFKKQNIEPKKTEVYGFDERIRFAEQNSTAAGINKYITFGINLPGTFKDNSVKSIASNLPRVTKFTNLYKLEETYRKLFKEAKRTLAKGGKIAFCTNHTDLLKESAEKEGLKLIEEREVKHGEDVLKIITFNS